MPRSHYPRSIIQNLQRLGFPADRIYPVNPKYQQILGLPCFPALAALPRPVSLTVLATPRDTVLELLKQCAAGGVRAAVVLADGFAEQGSAGKSLQDQLAEVARQAGITLLGPNTLGYLAPAMRVGVWAGGELPGPLHPGGVALAFQSSGMLNLVLSLAAHRHLGLAFAISVGNEAALDMAECIHHFVADPAVNVIGAFLESTLAPARLCRALAHAQDAGKPVVMLKVGLSERARRNALAHTGRLATAGQAWEALLQQLGVTLVQDLDELVETLVLYSHRRPLPGHGAVGLFTISGGDCSLLCDLAHRLEVPLPDPAPETRRVLMEALGKPSLLGNPLDLENIRREDPARYRAAVDAFFRDPHFDLVAFRMNLEREPVPSLLEMYRDLFQRAAAAGRMPVALTRAMEPLSSEWFRFFAEEGVALLQSYRTGLTAIGHLLRSAVARRETWAPVAVPEALADPDPPVRVLSWAEAQAWLREAGLPYVPARLAVTPEKAGEVAAAMGFPVAVKLISPALPHKSDAGAVRLGLADRQAVVAACHHMWDVVQAAHGPIPVEGFEVQAMVQGGVEMLLGLTWDPAVGPVVLVGMGGLFTEVLHDAILAIPPISHAQALALLDRLQGTPLLRGARGRPPADRAAMADLIVRFARAVVVHRDWLYQVDLNPVLVLPEGSGAVIVDVLVVARAGKEDTAGHDQPREGPRSVHPQGLADHSNPGPLPRPDPN